MKKDEKIAIVRILSDLIKADSIIDSGEIDQYMLLRDKYSINDNIEISATQITFADAIKILSKSDEILRQDFFSDCSDITISDGFCARSEALLMIALHKMLLTEDEEIDVISIPKPVFNIESASVLYVESRYEHSVNEVISKNYRIIQKECQIAGFKFIYIPKVIEHYKNSSPELIKQIIHFLAPSFSEDGIGEIVLGLKNMTTSSFCKDLLCNKLGVAQLRDINPSILIKIGQSYVDNEIYTNYLKIEVDENIVTIVQEMLDSFLSLISSDIISVSTAEDKNQQFLYHGFYKQLLDLFLIRKNVRSRLVIHPYKEEIYFPDIDCKLEKLHRREKALYVLLLILSNEGGVNFTSPQTAKQLEMHQNKMQKLQCRYQKIYELFGGEANKAPDLSQPEIRRPIISCLKRSIMQLKDKLYNHEDYMFVKNDFGNIRIGLEQNMISIHGGKKGIIPFQESEIYSEVLK